MVFGNGSNAVIVRRQDNGRQLGTPAGLIEHMPYHGAAVDISQRFSWKTGGFVACRDDTKTLRQRALVIFIHHR
jgi:hypothetical protein